MTSSRQRLGWELGSAQPGCGRSASLQIFAIAPAGAAVCASHPIAPPLARFRMNGFSLALALNPCHLEILMETLDISPYAGGATVQARGHRATYTEALLA
ncbi:hypothetical protein [Tibeticola sediminis]|uniref:hypothetical protein n=1 Tax=Tibeticola sediminis TaxID=1917811 RepID=UPI0014764439|nr:hypothetical protein [Tibeticola sediminis]